MYNIANLCTDWLGRNLLYHPVIESTNTFCMEHAAQLPHGTVVMSGMQTAGKGRLGRVWQHSAGQSLAMSVVLHSMQPPLLALLPLLAGLSVARALEDACNLTAGLKWSNDVVVMDKKLCGILCESHISSAHPTSNYAVVGIGLNLLQTQQELNGHNLVYATSLYLATAKKHTLSEIAGEILNKLEQVLHEYEKTGFTALRQDYANRCVTLGKEIEILSGEQRQHAVALDIGTDGCLLCNIAGKVVPIYAGEVSIRGQQGYC